MSHSQVMADVEPHLPSNPMTARAIWELVGCWSPSAIRQALNEFVRIGKAIRDSEPWVDGIRHTYRAADSSVPRTVPRGSPLARPGQDAKQPDPAVHFPLTRGARA